MQGGQDEKEYDPSSLTQQCIFTAFVLVICNVVGSVPTILLIAPVVTDSLQPNLAWKQTAWILSVAGNFTLLGSGANLITANVTKHHAGGSGLTYWQYLKFGVVSTGLSYCIGLSWTNILLHFQEKNHS